MARKSRKGDPPSPISTARVRRGWSTSPPSPPPSASAVAEGRVVMSKATLDLIVSGNAKKGDVLGTARIAGIMAAKRTSELIPLCHPLALSKVTLEIAPDARLPGCVVRATVQGHRPDRGRDGSADRRVGGVPDDLRHDQGGGARRAHRGHSPGRKKGRQIRATIAPENSAKQAGRRAGLVRHPRPLTPWQNSAGAADGARDRSWSSSGCRTAWTCTTDASPASIDRRTPCGTLRRRTSSIDRAFPGRNRHRARQRPTDSPDSASSRQAPQLHAAIGRGLHHQRK